MNLGRSDRTDLNKFSVDWALTWPGYAAEQSINLDAKEPRSWLRPGGGFPPGFPRRDTTHQSSRQEAYVHGLLLDLLARFINAPAREVDDNLDRALNQVCDAVGAERAQLWVKSGRQPCSYVISHEGARAPRRSQPEDYGSAAIVRRLGRLEKTSTLGAESKDLFPWLTAKLYHGSTLMAFNLEDLPAEAALDKRVLSQLEARSGVVIPFSIGGEVLGAMAFWRITERVWPEWQVHNFKHIATIFAEVIARKMLDQQLRVSELQLGLAADAANAALWSLDLISGRFEATAKAYEFVGLAPGSEFTFKSLLTRIHSDDRELLRRAREEVTQKGAVLCIEFRIVLESREARWVSARGRCQYGANGVAERLMGACVDITERKAAQEALLSSHSEIKQLKDRLQEESDQFKLGIEISHTHDQIIGQSKGMRRVLHEVEQVSPADCPVLITGETGTGKELIAQEIHRLSGRKDRVMVVVNCAALPAALIEGELFGRERGAYTGASTRQDGRFQIADGSTIFLDEVGELSPEVQAKLLRVLQQGEFQRLGSPKTYKVDVRVIAATNRNLAEEVRRGRFREDLYYRLSVFPIRVPPLRDRAEDIPLLVYAFLREFGTRMAKKITRLPAKAMEVLKEHSWPGNVRELRNVIEHSLILSVGDTLQIKGMTEPAKKTLQPMTLAEAEREHILRALESTSWRIKGPFGAAKRLAIQPSTLYSRMEKLGIPHRRQRDERRFPGRQ